MNDNHAPEAGDRGSPLLLATGLSKRYGATWALEDVSISVRSGEIVALSGENGSGKSTFAKIVAGIVKPDAGTVLFGGRPVPLGNLKGARSEGIALVSQEPALVPHLTVAENILLAQLPAPHRRFSLPQLVARARPILEMAGLEVDPAAKVASLSEPDRELIELAKALSADPRLLILDEATTRVADPARLFALVRRKAESGMATLLITHRLRDIKAMADRAVVLRDGHYVGELGRDELDEERLSAMMVGRELRELFPSQSRRPGEVLLHVACADAPRSLPLTVSEGEIVGMFGLMGAGRTELLETIAGARKDAYDISWKGRRLGPASVAGRLRHGIALLPEDRMRQGLIAQASIARNLTIGEHRAFSIAYERRDRRRARDRIRRYGIKAHSESQTVSGLSGGNQQKVLLARVLQRRPELLLLDEPTRGIDIGARHDIYELISQHAASGAAVLLASSDMVELLGICDRIVVVREGAVAAVVDRAHATEELLVKHGIGG
ncbi:ATP-binding cassette domain-containing protein [Streptomyces sp. NPDC007984]|uniref:sugar ABC transporter ATP-binding protein n=1 Tax=Streptomyces sp. NPDC007984 TaxID=3364801 RepID=UPI0036EC1E58